MIFDSHLSQLRDYYEAMSPAWNITTPQSTAGHDTLTCEHCGKVHSEPCPRIKAIDYFPCGTIRRVEYHDGR
jgi:hypothetical protein